MRGSSMVLYSEACSHPFKEFAPNAVINERIRYEFAPGGAVLPENTVARRAVSLT